MIKATEILDQLYKNRPLLALDMPSRKTARNFTDLCFTLMFPINARISCSSTQDHESLIRLESLLKSLLLPIRDKLDKDIQIYTEHFINKITNIYTLLLADAEAICDFDPAAENLEEVILAYPGFFAIAAYRISHELYNLKIPYVPRLISEYAHNQTGIDIHPGAKIGKSFFIDHGTGVVIGETAIIKENVKIYQGVTLGALQVQKELANVKRHPTVEENVIIYSNATILGGETIIGKNSIIGGNVWLTKSVNPDSVVYHKSETRIKSLITKENPIDFQI